MEEKRQRPRWLARPETYVVFYAPEPDYIGQVLDISLDGISYNFLKTREMSGDPIAVGILMPGIDFFLRKLPFSKSYSKVIKGPPGSTLPLRRFGGRFPSLTPHQKEKLADHISQYFENPAGALVKCSEKV